MENRELGDKVGDFLPNILDLMDDIKDVLFFSTMKEINGKKDIYYMKLGVIRDWKEGDPLIQKY